MPEKVAYYKLGLFIPIFCIIIVGMALLKKDPRDLAVAAKIVQNEGEEKPKVALTFDDGPHPRFTPMILDGLAQRNVKASFFLLGKNIEGHEEIVKRMYDDGHLIGNHTYSHERLTSLRTEKACEQIEKTSEIIYGITGFYPTYVRPPFGEWKKGLDCDAKMIPVMWTLDSSDWQSQNAPVIVKKVMDSVKDGDIILMHDWYDTSVTSAFEIIDELTERGFDFVTVDQLIYE